MTIPLYFAIIFGHFMRGVIGMIIFWIYVVTQLVSTAYGITVINSVRKVPALRKRLREQGYTQRDKNSLYKFNRPSLIFRLFIIRNIPNDMHKKK